MLAAKRAAHMSEAYLYDSDTRLNQFGVSTMPDGERNRSTVCGAEVIHGTGLSKITSIYSI